MYRNRFVTGPGSDDWNACIELCDLGLMEDRGAQTLAAGDHCFVVTGSGIRAMTEHSPSPPKLSRSQRRYRSYLNADCGMSFADWLKSGRYKLIEQQ